MSILTQLPGFMAENADELLRLTTEQVGLALISVGLSVAVGIPLGILLLRNSVLAESVISVANLVQTFPSLALLILMVPVVGIGATPTILALFVRAVLPLIKNTYVGLANVDPALIEAGTAIGMTRRQVLWRIRVPLALPLIVTGIRAGIIMAVSLATLGAAIGAGGLGEYIFSGIAQRDDLYLLAGALPVALLAIVLDALVGRIERLLKGRVA